MSCRYAHFVYTLDLLECVGNVSTVPSTRPTAFDRATLTIRMTHNPGPNPHAQYVIRGQQNSPKTLSIPQRPRRVHNVTASAHPFLTVCTAS